MDNLRRELQAAGLAGSFVVEDGCEVWVSANGQVKIEWLPGLQFYLVDPIDSELRNGQTARDAVAKAKQFT